MYGMTTGAILVLVAVLAGCQHGAVARESGLPAAAPTLPELQNATYDGVYEYPLTLEAGRWEGDAYVAGGASRPRAGLADGIYASGDLDGDGREEAAVVLWESGGGSGSYHYVAVLHREGGGIVNVDTVLVEDRPKILALRIQHHEIELELIQHGPGEAACCPTQHALRRWSLVDGKLIEGPRDVLDE